MRSFDEIKKQGANELDEIEATLNNEDEFEKLGKKRRLSFLRITCFYRQK